MAYYLQRETVNRTKLSARAKVLLRIALAILLILAAAIISADQIKKWQAVYYAGRAMESVRMGQLDEARDQVDTASALAVANLDVLRAQTFVYSLRNERIASNLWDELSARVELTDEEKKERERLRRYVDAACSSWMPTDSQR
jgi:hypothetical protein